MVIGGVERKARYFVIDLPHSDGCFVKAYPAETIEAFLDGHVKCLSLSGRSAPEHPLRQYQEDVAAHPLLTGEGYGASSSVCSGGGAVDPEMWAVAQRRHRFPWTEPVDSPQTSHLERSGRSCGRYRPPGSGPRSSSPGFGRCSGVVIKASSAFWFLGYLAKPGRYPSLCHRRSTGPAGPGGVLHPRF